MNGLNYKKMYSVRSAPAINEIIKPFRNWGIDSFTHDITFGKGQISILTDRTEIFEHYYKNEIPMVCTNDQGRILQPDIYLDCKLKQEHYDYRCSFNAIENKFNIKNFLHIAENDKDCQHLYSFSFSLSEISFLHFVVNHSQHIKQFISTYKFKARHIIHEMKQPKHRISLPLFNKNEMENKVISAKNLLSEKHTHKYFINKNNKMPTKLTSQQFKCLALLIEGNTTKEIARKLILSPRTVEFYFENIKKKLGCNHSKELISSYYMDFANLTWRTSS